MNKLESLGESEKIWRKLKNDGNNYKPFSDYIFNCPCCHYVFEELLKDDGFYRFNIKDCMTLCPIEWEWDKYQIDISEKRLCHSMYYDWMGSTDIIQRKQSATVIWELIKKSIDNVK